ncbi:MAG: hypothetical protein ACR2IB_03490 [Pyrinomonadaceae bacterium]
MKRWNLVFMPFAVGTVVVLTMISADAYRSTNTFIAVQDSSLANAEYGEPSELINLHSVYVTTSDLKVRDSIVRELIKYDGLTISKTMESAAFVLTFEGSFQSFHGLFGGSTHIYYRSQLTAFIWTPQGRRRILWHANSTGKDAPVKSARELVKTLKKLRGGKGQSPAVIFSSDKDPALERGYRTGYSDGYNAGYKDVSDRAARDYQSKDEYQRGDRSYNKAWGTAEDYREGYQQGFEVGYAAGYDRRSFDSSIPTGLTRREKTEK